MSLMIFQLNLRYRLGLPALSYKLCSLTISTKVFLCLLIKIWSGGFKTPCTMRRNLLRLWIFFFATGYLNKDCPLRHIVVILSPQSVARRRTEVPGPCLTTAIWRCRKNSSQWQRSFQWKLHSHWLKFLRQRHVAIVRQGPGQAFQPQPNAPNDIAVHATTVFM